MSPEFIEVFGIPASGKTMLVNQLCGTHGAVSREEALRRALTLKRLGLVRWMLHRSGLSGGSFDEITCGLLEQGVLADRRLVQTVFDHLVQAGVPDREAGVALRGIFRTAREYALLTEASADARVLMDEGWIHRALTVFGMRASDEVPDEWLQRYADSVPAPRFAIYIECDPETSFSRVSARERKARFWWGEWTESEQRRALAQTARCAARIAEHLAARGVRVVRTDGTVSAELMELMQG
ncbi:MAG: hypothetical protein PHD86_06935 [Kiritimatiellae bacterium]|nr:hypothetical protein [Kiritimatiellia bacterium]